MSTYEWLGLAIAVPAGLVLLGIVAGSAWRMSPREAAAKPIEAAGAIAVLVGLMLADRWLGVSRMPVIELGFNLANFTAGCLILYALVTGATLLFRSRLRAIGAQLVVMAAVTLWWLTLATTRGRSPSPWHPPHSWTTPPRGIFHR